MRGGGVCSNDCKEQQLFDREDLLGVTLLDNEDALDLAAAVWLDSLSFDLIEFASALAFAAILLERRTMVGGLAMYVCNHITKRGEGEIKKVCVKVGSSVITNHLDNTENICRGGLRGALPSPNNSSKFIDFYFAFYSFVN